MKHGESPSLHILGAGAFGSALSIAYSRFSAFKKVFLWSRKPLDRSAEFPRLPSFFPPKALHLRSGLPALADLSPLGFIFFATPTQALRQTAQNLPKELPQKIPLITCCKGLEKETSLQPLDILKEFFPHNPKFVLAGPNFAKEIAANLPAVATLAGEDFSQAALYSKQLSLPSFSLTPDDNPTALQLSGAAKNVAAIGVGALMGAGLGENARAAFITLFFNELWELVEKISDTPKSLLSFGGIGDFLLTTTSSASRNYALGEHLGKNKAHPSKETSQKSAVSEGVFTAPALLAIAHAYKLKLPAVSAINEILKTPSQTEEIIRSLLKR